MMRTTNAPLDGASDRAIRIMALVRATSVFRFATVVRQAMAAATVARKP